MCDLYNLRFLSGSNTFPFKLTFQLSLIRMFEVPVYKGLKGLPGFPLLSLRVFTWRGFLKMWL